MGLIKTVKNKKMENKKTFTSILLYVPLEIHAEYKMKKIRDNDSRTLEQIYIDIITKNLKK